MAIEPLLGRSQEFLEHLLAHVATVEGWDSSARSLACASSCQLALEHGQAVCVLFTASLPNAACVSLRAQYEAVLRASWLLYSASPAEVNRLLQPLTIQTEQGAKNLPQAGAMLAELEALLPDSPGLSGLVLPLAEAHGVLWKALNSFAHAGIHALHRTEHGFPEPLASDVIRNSNVLTHLSARLLVRTGGPTELHHNVDRAWMGFEDCLPSVRPA